MTTRIGSLSQQQLLLARIHDVQQRLIAGEAKLASGQKYNSYSEIGTDLPRYLDLTEDVSRANRYLDNIRVGVDRIKLAESALASMTEIVKQMNSVAGTVPSDFESIGSMARNNLMAFASLLNEQDGTRALFAGTNVDGPAVVVYPPGTGPVADGTTVIGSTAAGATNDGYRFQIMATGTSADTAIQVDETTRADIQVNANPASGQNAFTTALNALVNLADFDTAANPTPTETELTAARTDLTTALNGTTAVPSLDTIRTELGARLAFIQSVQATHQNFVRYAGQALTDLQQVDTAELATSLNLDQTRLQASFAALARINQISLLDYL